MLYRMDQRELDYIDLRDPQARHDYIDNAPQPQQGAPLPEQHQPVLVLPPLPRAARGRPRKDPTGQTEKSSYVKATARQKAQLGTLFAQNGDAKTPEWYASQVGIPVANTKFLLRKIRRGESILPKNHYKRKSRVIPFQHLVLRILTIDPTTPLREIRDDLESVVALHGDEVADIPETAIDAIVAEKRRAREERTEEVEEERSQTVDEGSETVEVAETHRRFSVPSVTAISRFLRGVTGTDDGREILIVSFKKCTVRGPAANTDDNKMRHLEAIQQLRDKMAAGYWWVCIDETSWSVGNTTAYGWSRRGDPCFITKARGGIALTSVSSIDMRGVGYCNLTTTTNTTETFNAYFRHIIAKYDEVGIRCIF